MRSSVEVVLRWRPPCAASDRLRCCTQLLYGAPVACEAWAVACKPCFLASDVDADLGSHHLRRLCGGSLYRLPARFCGEALAARAPLARPRSTWPPPVLRQWPSRSVTTVMPKPGTRKGSDGGSLGIPGRSCRTTGRSAGCGRSSQEAAARWPATSSCSLTKTRPRAGFLTIIPRALSSACRASQFVSPKACAG
jgi:hypothetical protein